MRSFYYREIIPPDVERRNYILKKLAFLKGRVKKRNESTKKLIQLLRRQLKASDGRVLYYRVNKGLKMLIGDETTLKKKFLLSKDPRFLESVVSKLRAKNRKPSKTIYKEKYLESVDMNLNYKTVGGVLMASNHFGHLNKNLQRERVRSAKYPKDMDSYIGIELEYASSLNHDQIAEKIIEAKLQHDVRVIRDTSIRTNEIYKYQVEFCILTKWSGLKETLNRLKPIIFDKPQHFSPNDTCGLHVHLDVRNDDFKRVYRNLTSMQSVLFNLAAEYRRENKYCRPIPTTNWDEVDEHDDKAHYDAISKYSFFKQETIEVRIHQSTLALTQIEKWITLLKRIADYQGEALGFSNFEAEFQDLVTKVKIEPELIQYIEERKAL